MLGVRLDKDLDRRLAALAKATKRSKSYYAKEAIRQFLEDREDYLLGLAGLERVERGETTITLDQLERQLGLDR